MDASALQQLYQQHFGAAPSIITQIAAHASARQIFRLSSNAGSAIGVLNLDRAENNAFIVFSNYFRSRGLAVPRIYQVAPDQSCYLQEDLGDVTLYNLVEKARQRGDGFTPELVQYYEVALEHLVFFQASGQHGFDFTHCVSAREFDRAGMLWDMNYFRQSFLERTPIKFDQDQLQGDFARLADFLSHAPTGYFMYRDFQSRNIMVKEGDLYFIDFQGGRRGPLQYDLVSLVYQSKAQIPDHVRQSLIRHYLEALTQTIPIDIEEFNSYLSVFVVLRVLQALGTYGAQGLAQGKEYFSDSIPLALENLRQCLQIDQPALKLNALGEVFNRLFENYLSHA